MNYKFKSILFLLVLIIFCLTPSIEGFQMNSLPGKYPISVDKPTSNGYPFSGRRGVSSFNANQISSQPPISSHEQITNNLRYRYNPDNGTCFRSEFCNTLYDSIKTKSNEVYPLPPVKDGNGTRIGYFRTDGN